MLRRPYQILLLSALILAAYYPANFAGFSGIDDQGMYGAVVGIQRWDLRSIFFPSTTGGLYYRPMLVISFMIDKLMLGLIPALMHLENVLLHLANAVLVFFLTRHLLPENTRDNSFAPLAAGLLFGLHPIATESVNWISGRTDVLAGSFLLLSIFFLLKYLESGGYKYIFFSITVFLAGAFTKDTAIAFLPGAFLLTISKPGPVEVSSATPSPLYRYKIETRLAWITAGILLYYVVRKIAFPTHASHFGLTIRMIFTDWNYTLFTCLRAFGFYLKKLVIPYPLNFVITDVNSFYEILAVPLVLLCVYIATRNTRSSALFVIGLLLLLPSFLIAFGQIAWSPYAERYL